VTGQPNSHLLASHSPFEPVGFSKGYSRQERSFLSFFLAGGHFFSLSS
jgi:hypothetical protein